jgi:nitrate/nitrite transporter NarK
MAILLCFQTTKSRKLRGDNRVTAIRHLPTMIIALAIVVLGTVGSASGYSTWIIVGLLFWVLPVFVGYRLHLSKDRDSPIVLALFLGWVGVLFALAIPAAGKRCPRCDETIRRNATVCRFCGSDLVDTGGTT